MTTVALAILFGAVIGSLLGVVAAAVATHPSAI